MSTIVNARDVILQAYSPRVATTSMSSNLTVSQSQVTGLGIVVAGTKIVFLSAETQVFQIAKSGAVSPASTTLTAKLQNLTNTPTLTVISGTITPTPTLTALSVTIPYTSLLTDTALIRLAVVQDGITYTDEITLVKVREGIDGLTGFLTNESHSVPADYLGNVLAYTDAGGSFKVYQGVNDISSICSYAIAPVGNPSGLTASINATTGVYVISGGYPTSVDLVTLTLRATFGTTTLDKVFTLAKSKAGAAGTNGTSASNGVRGSRTFYVTLTGSTNTYSDTLATTTASVESGPVLNDLVTQYNTSQGFSQSKFYTSGGWVIVNAVVDGNLLVSGTVGATQLQANILNADNILTRGLTVRDASGNIILSSAIPLDFSRVAGTTSGKIDSANITTFISGAAISNAQIATLEASKITTGFLDAARIQAGTITADKINGNSLAVVNGTFSGSLSGATGTFSGALSAASGTYAGSLTAATGTFSGLLTASAINAVSTINIAGNAVSTMSSASGSAASISTTISVPAWEVMHVLAIGFKQDDEHAQNLELYVDGVLQGTFAGAAYTVTAGFGTSSNSFAGATGIAQVILPAGTARTVAVTATSTRSSWVGGGVVMCPKVVTVFGVLR